MKNYKWRLDKTSGIFSADAEKRKAEVRSLFANVLVITLTEENKQGELIALDLHEAISRAEEFFENGDFSECEAVGHSQKCYEEALWMQNL